MENSNREEKNEDEPILDEEKDYEVDFVTSSAISNVGYKFLATYIPIFWFGGYLTVMAIHGIFTYVPFYILIFILPLVLFAAYYVFTFGCLLSTKLFLVLVNLIHQPKEGIFPAVEGNNDFEFWRMRVELKKLGVWFLRNNPLPWSDAWAFRWFGVRMDFSSHLQDAWVDVEFIEFGHNVLVGQDAVLMSSMVVGNYLIIKKLVIDDYCVVGGISTVGPGSKLGKDALLGAVSVAINQELEDGWIYFGNPARKLKENKLAVTKIVKKEIDEEKKIEIEIEVNIDEEKKQLIQNNNQGEENVSS